MANATDVMSTFGKGPLNYGQDFISQAQTAVGAAQTFNNKPGTLSYSDIKTLWIQNGGDPAWAPLMAGIALAESGGDTRAWNKTPPDNSVGLWQINYYGGNLQPRTARYGDPLSLSNNPNAQAKAAIDLLGSNGAGINNWKGDPTWMAWTAGGSPKAPSDVQVVSYLNQKGISPGGTGGGVGSSPDLTPGTPGTCNAGSKGIQLDAAKSIPVVGGLFPSVTVFNACQTKAIAGGLMVSLGGQVLLIGMILIVAGVASQTKIGQQAAGRAAAVTPQGRVAGALGAVGRSSTTSKAIGGARRTRSAPSRVARQSSASPVEAAREIPRALDGQSLDSDERAAFRASGPSGVRSMRKIESDAKARRG